MTQTNNPGNNTATPYGTLSPISTPSARKPMSLPRLREMHSGGEKITMLTAKNKCTY